MYQSFKVTHHAQSRIANVSSSCSASRVHELLSVPAPTVTIGLLKSQCMCNASMHHTQQSKRQATIAMEPTLHVQHADALCVAFHQIVSPEAPTQMTWVSEQPYHFRVASLIPQLV